MAAGWVRCIPLASLSCRSQAERARLRPVLWLLLMHTLAPAQACAHFLFLSSCTCPCGAMRACLPTACPSSYGEPRAHLRSSCPPCQTTHGSMHSASWRPAKARTPHTREYALSKRAPARDCTRAALRDCASERSPEAGLEQPAHWNCTRCREHP